MATIVDAITQAAQNIGVDPKLAIEVARAESNLDPNTPDSSAGAIGLFQLEPATAAALGVDPRDVNQNIQGGITYLGQLLGQFSGSIPAALAAYDWGPTNVSKAMTAYGANWISHLPAETTAYVTKIVRNLQLYTATVTPASVANGIVQALSPDQATTPPAPTFVPAAAAPVSYTGIVIVAALAVGAYIFAEVFLE